jgi:Ran GTPase-activating protein (RanGAP) involved in mRNA processing and transport
MRYVEKTKHLFHLDISWNSLSGKQTQDLCGIIKENRTLKSLNLSWNSIVNPSADKFKFSNVTEATRLKDELKIFQQKERRDGAKNLAEAMFKNLSKVVVSKKLPGVEVLTINHLGHFVKHNKKLIHLNLSYMGMCEKSVNEFGPVLRRSKSLLSVHLSGNPGNTLQAQ